MFKAMFSGDFRESNAKVVSILQVVLLKLSKFTQTTFIFLTFQIIFPGVAQDTFLQLLTYLYTDELSGTVSFTKCLELLEVANRLCLQRLISMIEQRVVDQLTAKCEKEGDAVEQCLRLLEPCKVLNYCR